MLQIAAVYLNEICIFTHKFILALFVRWAVLDTYYKIYLDLHIADMTKYKNLIFITEP
jgi:hypothetical protein